MKKEVKIKTLGKDDRVYPVKSIETVKAVRQREEEIRDSLLKFFAENITHGCDRPTPQGIMKGIIINVPTYTDLVKKCSEYIGIDLVSPRKITECDSKHE